MQTNELTGRISLVTGASRGIGRAIAMALAGAGADIAVNYRTHEGEAQDACRQIEGLGRRCAMVQADVSSSADVARMVKTAEQKLGTVSILVNNAGTARPHTIEDMNERDWNDVIATNLTSVFLVTQAVLPRMRSQHWGRIITISSVAAQLGGVVGPHYAASKAGVLGLTHYYAAHLAKEGITVNAIAPGPVRTALLDDLPHLTENVIPIGRFGTPEEIAAVALMLARNAYITGQTVNANGGRYMS
jgi:3-oxoacyl-[acyl-carrier protein] reductase